MITCLDSAHGSDWTLYRGDCVDVCRQLPDRSVDLAIYSPPFSNLYIYSDSERDMGNCADDAEFLRHYRYLVTELFRLMRPGRVVAVHCKDLVNYKGRDGKAGLRDFPGEIIRMHQDAGFAYHSRFTIWKDPVIEMQRTKAHGLLYKQLRKDSTFSRQGLAEYVVVFRKWADETSADVEPVTHTEDSFPLDQWQKWASPIWDDINQTRVLNVTQARDDKDSKHICPLQLDVIERAVRLWTNPGDVVLSPFSGIGSEGVVTVNEGRKFIGIELKDTYFAAAVNHLEGTHRQMSLFDYAGAAQ